MNRHKKKREKPVKLLTLDAETRGLFGDVFRVGMFDGERYHAANTFRELKNIILHYSIKYDVHIYIHNLDFDLSKIAEEVAAGVDFEESIFIHNNVAVFSTSLQTTQNESGESVIKPAPVVFHDSLKILPGKLADLCESFGLKEDERKIDLKQHIESRGWGVYDKEGHYLKFESEGNYFNRVEADEPQLNIYLEYDCRSLHSLIMKALDLSNLDEEEFVRCPTAASLAMKVYKEVWGEQYDEAVKSNFRGKFGEFVEDSIREAYYGGRTEVFKPQLDDGFHYDVNSLYPYVMKTNVFPVGWYDHYRGADAKKMLGFWLSMQEGGGFAEIDIYVPETLHIPPLPKRHEGKLMFPVGHLSGTWAFPEIAEAIRAGCRIGDVHQVFYFKNMKPIFKDFVEYWEAVKTTSTGAKREFSKLMQNSLYGKFGMQRKRRTLVPIEYKDTFEEAGELYVKRYHPVLKKEFLEVETKAHAAYIQPQIAAYVTAYARIELYRGLRDESTGEKYYCDTDSIVSKERFPDEKVDPNEYGKWDLENEIETGIYIQPKLYFEQTKTWDAEHENYKQVKKAKGIPKDQMKYFTESRYMKILDQIRDGADRVELYENVRKNKKFVTKLKNGEEFNATEMVKKGINLRAMQKREMDYQANVTRPHQIHEWGPVYEENARKAYEKQQKMMEEKILAEYAYDEIKEKIKQIGYIQTMKKGDYYYAEYQDLSRSAKMTYFRKKGEPLDSWCEAAGLEVNDVLEELAGK